MSFKYQVGDLNLVSDIELPILRSKEFASHDIKVLIGPKLQIPNKTIEFLPNNRILYKDVCDNVFLIDKSKILVSIKDKNIDQASISILGIPLGYLLQNNNFQVLHGSSVTFNGSAISFIGKSGVGKSSLAMSLVDKGLKLVTEDLCLIKNSSIYNFSNWVKTNNKSFPLKIASLGKILIKKDSRNRSFYKLDDRHISSRKNNLKSIYFFEDAKHRSIKKLEAAESFKYLFTYAYRKNDIDVDSFKKLAEISEKVECFLFSRDIERPLEDNSEFIFDYLNKNL
jgi:hypothetical protein